MDVTARIVLEMKHFQCPKAADDPIVTKRNPLLVVAPSRLIETLMKCPKCGIRVTVTSSSTIDK